MRTVLFFAGLGLVGCAAPAPVRFAVGDRDIAVAVDEEPFCVYRWSERLPAIWPLLAEGGVPVTRAFPLADVAGEAKDHPHHLSLWFAHGDVDGIDFWAGKGRIEHAVAPVADARTGTIAGECRWLGPDGREIARDQRRWTFAAAPEQRSIDLDLTLIAGTAGLRLGDTKEGTLALRLRREFCLRGDGAAGAIETSAGHRDGAAWGKRARWVVYRAPVDGRDLAVAIFDHPDNPGAPTHWHARDYGLFAANPFGLHDFTGAPAGTGDLRLRPGEHVRFRYRVLLRQGHADAAAIDASWQQWVAESR
ncbi:MAG: PmoA family protein [Planctomycetes bacterium]|nr:PmoA family protein [Planctomycetota bacterium]